MESFSRIFKGRPKENTKGVGESSERLQQIRRRAKWSAGIPDQELEVETTDHAVKSRVAETSEKQLTEINEERNLFTLLQDYCKNYEHDFKKIEREITETSQKQLIEGKQKDDKKQLLCTTIDTMIQCQEYSEEKYSDIFDKSKLETIQNVFKTASYSIQNAHDKYVNEGFGAAQSKALQYEMSIYRKFVDIVNSEVKQRISELMEIDKKPNDLNIAAIRKISAFLGRKDVDQTILQTILDNFLTMIRKTEGDASVRNYIYKTLKKHGDEKTVKGLEKMIEEERFGPLEAGIVTYSKIKKASCEIRAKEINKIDNKSIRDEKMQLMINEIFSMIDHVKYTDRSSPMLKIVGKYGDEKNVEALEKIAFRRHGYRLNIEAIMALGEIRSREDIGNGKFIGDLFTMVKYDETNDIIQRGDGGIHKALCDVIVKLGTEENVKQLKDLSFNENIKHQRYRSNIVSAVYPKEGSKLIEDVLAKIENREIASSDVCCDFVRVIGSILKEDCKDLFYPLLLNQKFTPGERSNMIQAIANSGNKEDLKKLEKLNLSKELNYDKNDKESSNNFSSANRAITTLRDKIFRSDDWSDG